MKKLLEILIIVNFLTGVCSFGEEKVQPRFSLTVKKDCVELINDKMRVKTVPGKLSTYFTGPFGNFGSYGFHYALAEIKVETDTEEEKCVSLISPIQHQKGSNARSVVFTLTLTAKVISPGIELRAMMKNVGEYPSLGSYYYRLVGLKFPYYYDADGWQYAGKPTLPETDWLFLPSANTVGGYGLILLDPKAEKITTLYPRGDWQPVGLYFSPRKRRFKIKPGDSYSIGFKIFPALSKWQVLDQFRKEKMQAQN